MKLENPIGWTDATGNMVIGCTKVSEGCKACYAANDTPARVLRAGKWPGTGGRKIETWGPTGHRWPVKALAEKAARLNKFCICDTCRNIWRAPQDVGKRCMPSCGGTLRRIRLFANSNSDWLDDKWPIETVAQLLQIIHDCPNIDFQLLTKRPEQFDAQMSGPADYFGQKHSPGFNTPMLNWLQAWRRGEKPPANLWLGVSTENQRTADERIPALLRIPAAVRFLSCEPLLGPISLDPFPIYRKHPTDPLRQITDLHWVICGGESDVGKQAARPCDVQWIRSIVAQCHVAGVPCYVKQLGSHVGDGTHRQHLLDRAGANPAEWPEQLRVRQFPAPLITSPH